MPIGSFTQQFDFVNLLLVLFVAFFLCLIYYLRQEDKREGYPLISHRTSGTEGRIEVVGFPPMPKPKVFHRPHGKPPVYAPRLEELPPIDATNLGNLNGNPILPNGDPMLSGTGAAAWVAREDEPELDYHGDPVFRPLREATAFRVMPGDADPRGFPVLGLDKKVAGRVVDLWIMGGEHYAQFLEVALAPEILAQRSVREPHEKEHPESESEREVVAISVIEERIATPEGSIELTEIDVVTAPTHEHADGEGESHHAHEKHEHPHHDEWTERVKQDEKEMRPPERGHVLLPLAFASVNGRAGIVRSAAVTAAQFANVPGRKKDLSLTAREEQKIRAYYGSGYLWATPDRTGPLL